MRYGSLALSGVELREGGQYDTEDTVIKMENIVNENISTVITKSSFYDCKSYCFMADNTLNTELTQNVFYKGRLFHVQANNIQSFTFTQNLMIAATRRPTLSADELITCYATWTAIHDDNVNIRNNICQGSHLHGFVLPHIPCSSLSNSPYTNNTVGSASVGFIFNIIG